MYIIQLTKFCYMNYAIGIETSLYIKYIRIPFIYLIYFPIIVNEINFEIL